MAKKTLTRTGYLGQDREIRSTRQATRPARRWNPVAEMFDEGEYTSRCREYAVLSLGAHRWQNGRRGTTWHRLIVWDVDRMEWFNVRHARKGDKVRIEGYEETFTFTGDDGRRHEVRQIVVTRYQCLEKAVARRRRTA